MDPKTRNHSYYTPCTHHKPALVTGLDWTGLHWLLDCAGLEWETGCFETVSL